MRRLFSLAGSAAREALSEPLSAVMFLVATSTIHLLPVFHCHQFGEPARLPRECGFSGLMVFGLVFSTAAAMRAIGREIESGTAAAALSRPVSRPLFFVGKILGVLAAFALFGVAVAAASSLAVVSAEAGAVTASAGGSRIWGPGVAAGLGLTLLAFIGAALANRLAQVRFCSVACVAVALAQPLALGLAAIVPGAAAVDGRTVPAMLVLATGCAVFTVMAGALAVRLRPAVVAALVAVAVAAAFAFPLRVLLPDLNRFWLVDRFAGGGVVPWGEIAGLVSAGGALVALWMVVGSLLLTRRDLP